MIGFDTLSGSTRVKVNGTLVRLDELPGSGPQGPQGETGPQGPQGAAGEDADTTQFYTKLQTDFALLANRPSASISDGVVTYDASTHTIRNVLGTGGIVTHIFQNPTDPSDSRNGALVVNGDNVSGGGGLDPNYITLANDQITHLKPTTVTNLSAASVAIGTQGMVSFGNVTVGLAGNGTLYANGGLEGTTMTIAGVGNVSTLNVNNDIACNHATSTSIIANKNLTLGQDGDLFGSTRLHLRNRSGENGAIFETTDPTVTLVD